jgi:16S rRNA (guanine966-N2)-methyltransferase
MIRIVSGRFKRSTLLLPPASKTRPTKDQAREAIFNILEHKFHIFDEPITVLDAFAGSGALGLEALSWGARKCYFVENDREVFPILKKNIEKLCIDEEAILLKKNVMVPSKINEKVDLVFADPPYGIYDLENILSVLKPWFKETTLFVWESSSPVKKSSSMEILEERHYGIAYITFLRPNIL